MYEFISALPQQPAAPRKALDDAELNRQSQAVCERLLRSKRPGVASKSWAESWRKGWFNGGSMVNY